MAGAQHQLTVVAAVVPGRRDELDAELAHIRAELGAAIVSSAQRARFPFSDMPTLHFARLTVADFSTDIRRPSEPRLVLCTDFDGEVDAHIDALATVAVDVLDRIFACCVGYHALAGDAAYRVRTFIALRRRIEQVPFTGAIGRTVGQIRDEHALRAAIQTFLDQPGTAQLMRGGADHAALGAIRTHVLEAVGGVGTPRFAWAESPVAIPVPNQTAVRVMDTLQRHPYLIPAAYVLLLIVLALLHWWVTFALVVSPVVWIFVAERLAPRARNPAPTLAQRQYMAVDNRRSAPGAQTPLTAITITRPGGMALLRLSLWLMRTLIGLRYVEGDLAGIRGIHFARWVIVDRTLLFCSNYDGEWGGYLGEFIDRAASGLNIFWSTASGYPRTRIVTGRGALAEQRFKAFVHHRQVPTTVWYSAYALSTLEVLDNTRLRNGLFAPPAALTLQLL